MKAALRREVAGRMGALSPRERRDAADGLLVIVKSLAEYAEARAVLGFWPLDDEIDVRPILRDASAAGKAVALPVSVVETGELTLRSFRGEERLVEGAYGIAEPAAGEGELSPEVVDLVLVPGKAFDLSGNRLGRGKGYYDRFLPRLGESAFRLGVAYEVQVFERVPVDEHDVPVHVVATEGGLRRCGRKSERLS